MIGFLAILHVPVMFVGMTSSLDSLVTRCAPNVGPVTMKAIVSVESGGNPYAINDDTARHSYMPKSLEAAVAVASDLIAKGHNFDAGIAQVNSMNFTHEGLSLSNMFDPCASIAAGSRILGRSYAAAAAHLWIDHAPRSQADVHEQEQMALRHAFSIYNSGSAWKSMHYADQVVSAAGRELASRPFIITRTPAFPLRLPAQPSTQRIAYTGASFRSAQAVPKHASSGFSPAHHPSIATLQLLAAASPVAPSLRDFK